MKNETLKRELCNKLIKEGKVQVGDVIKHSYTQQIMDGNKKAIETSDEMITLTTRGDCVGVAVKQNYQLTKDTENYIEWFEKGKHDTDTRAWKEHRMSGTLTTGGGAKCLKVI